MSWLGDAIRKIFKWATGRPSLNGSPRTKLKPQSDDPISVQFCDDVDKASRLLDFLIEEGHPYHIPDQIIDDIESARESVKQSTAPSPAPSPEARARLLKAYRDLVAIPGTAVLFDFPPAHFWQSWWRRAFLLIALGVPITFLLITLIYCPWRPYWYWPVGFGVVSALIIWGLYVFTGIVTNRKLNQIIAFCYIFTGLMLAASTLPWAMPNLFSGDAAMKAPVGVLRGCAEGPDTSADIPPGVRCGDDKENKENKDNKEKKDNYQWILNIGGVIQNPPQKPEAPRGYRIRGGLVVPLYVIILALFGGAVSMTRRVPEYQRRSMSAKDPFTNQEARENLVFQIMQVVSAPLIAIVAYYIVHPTTNMWAVVLGFGSGFASEPILLMIRGLVEKLSPAGAPRPSPIAVRVDPPTKDLEPGKSHQFIAHVSGAPSSEVTWLIAPSDAGSISQSGYYTAPQKEGITVTITACSVADRTKCGNASVTIKRAGTNTATPPPLGDQSVGGSPSSSSGQE